MAPRKKRWIKEELAWAAGFFDGEGCTTLHRTRDARKNEYVYPWIHIGQVDKRPLERFLAAVGCGRLWGPYQRGGPNNRPAYALTVRSLGDVMQTIACLWSYLSEPKREQIREVVYAWRKRSG